VPPSVMLSSLPAAIRKYRRLYPGVQFALRELSTSAIENALRAGEIDLGFLREVTTANSEVVFEEGVVAALPSSHRLAKTKELRIAALRGEPFVFFPRRLGPAFYDRLLSFCTDAGFLPDVVQEATQWHSVICLVEAGMGISLAPGCVQRFKWSGVVYRPLRGLRTRVSAAWNGNGSATVTAFLRVVRETE
ncbi:MAG: LysR family substrate-binding domain-containing protein, partial [Candidatus Solibacter sp.]